MIRALPSLCLLAMVASPQLARSAVYEVGEDGSVQRIDVQVPASAVTAKVLPTSGRKTQNSPAGLERARAYRPFIFQAAERHGVSAALIDAVAYTESRYNQNAVSPAGASGVMQLMPGTARDLGVDRTDAAANIHGGAAYLRLMLNKFNGNIICALSAYNAGPGAVSEARCIPPYKETKAYVAAVLDRLSASAL